MKKKYLLLSITLFAVLFTSCKKSSIEPIDKSLSLNVLIYLAADNNLLNSAKMNLDSLRRGEYPKAPSSLLVFFDDGTDARLISFSNVNGQKQENVVHSYGIVNSADPSVFQTVISDSRSYAPADNYGLILWSHGTGWLPSGAYGKDPGEEEEVLSSAKVTSAQRSPKKEYFPFEYDIFDSAYPQVKSFGADHGKEMEIADLVRAIGSNTYYFIAFDACLMACVETAYDLKAICKYFMASPTEILTDGFQYKRLYDFMYTNDGIPDVRGFAQSYYDQYAAYPLNSLYRSATISIVESAALDNLATVVKTIVSAHRDELSKLSASQVQTYDRLSKHLFFDLSHYLEQVSSTAEINNLQQALQAAVPYKAATPKFITIDIKHYSGLSVYIPNPAYTKLQAAYINTAWNKATGMIQ